ncbi:MAG: four helix bundle protein [Kiritimatiellae bacterium]|nr:four helix bundle protein [Kiritimatiellia bacterium]MDD4442463.1 four helix bundle protein [Kiritimatiellia bacterium]
MRASQSIPLNIAEGNGKTTDADRRRCFELARRNSGLRRKHNRSRSR